MSDTRLSSLGRLVLVLSVLAMVAALVMAAVGPVVMFGGMP